LATTSNAAHNVVIDIFAFGGYPLLLAYLGFILLVIIAIIKVTRRSRTYSFVFVAMVAGWICYQVQSIISINQIGLGIWGWLFGACLIAYERTNLRSIQGNQDTKPSRKTKSVNSNFVSPKLIAGVGVVIGTLIASPPLMADSKFKAAMDSKDVAKVEAAMEPGFYNWSDSYRYGLVVQTLANSNLPDLALKYARKAADFNPEFFSAWQQLYSLENSTAEEKSIAIRNMKRLDPLNPDVTKFQ
jgi:hypothetical protein